jgi:rubrerythrin
MSKLKGTETEKNLLAAFAGESQARNKYTYFASVAKKEGYRQIEGIFQETADNEKEHAKRFFKLLEGGEVEIQASFPAGVIGTTAENLKEAADGELLEWGTIYRDAAEIARKEGFENIAIQFEEIAKVEMHHEARYRKLLDNLNNGSVFKKNEKVTWHCRNCGYVLEGIQAPEKCPACEHPQAHFQLKAENY